MSRCSNCGRESPPGAIFCLSCGVRLDAVGAMHAPVAGAGPGVRVGVSSSPVAGASSSTPASAPGLPGRVPCPVCRGENQAGMNFCRLCGSPLVATSGAPSGRPASPPPAGAPEPGNSARPKGPDQGNTVRHNAPGGRPAAPPPARPAAAAPPPSGQMPTPVPGARLAAPEMHTCRRCGGNTQSGFAFCQHCGAMLPKSPGGRAGNTPPIEPVSEVASGDVVRAVPVPIPVPARIPTPVPGAVPPRPAAERAWGALYSVRRDGSDGDRYPLAGDWVEIGRPGASADLVFEDRYLASRHARIEQQPGGSCRVVPIDLLNGVYRRIRAPQVLPSGAQILIGRELLRFELVEDGEREASPLQRFGITLFGSPPRSPWGRIMQLLASGGQRDVRHLSAGEIVLGREEGDIVFRDDEFLSRRHAALKWQGGQCVLEDLKSSNGTFVRLRGPQPLENGDTLRMGDQMFRIELGGG